MNVLVMHSRYLSGAASGENRVVEDESRLLRDHGHSVDMWTRAVHGGFGGNLSAAASAIWSQASSRAASPSQGARPFDVIHVHNLFPNVSPAPLRTTLPTILTLHNFRLACIAGTFLRDGRICEDCLGRAPWPGVAHGCYRESRLASAPLAASLALHRTIRTFDRVTLFSSVSGFVRDKISQAGIDRDRIRVRPNFAWPTERRQSAGEYFLSLGRLSDEKGLDTVVRNWQSKYPLLVVGDGPERRRLENIASGAVRFCGAVGASEVPRFIQSARATLVPSRCYEGSPRTIAESFAAGVPVLASRLGGLPEHIQDGVSGLLLEPEDPDVWAAAIEELEYDDRAEQLGDGAYRAWEERFSPDVGLRALEELYREAVALQQNVD